MSAFSGQTLDAFLAGEMTLCDSEAVRAAQYLEANGEMRIQFTSSGKWYSYFVSKGVAYGFARADSKGRWIADHFPRLNW